MLVAATIILITKLIINQLDDEHACAGTADASEVEAAACAAVTALDDETACAAAANCAYSAA